MVCCGYSLECLPTKKNMFCGYSLEVPLWCNTNEYQQNMFLWRNKKNINWFWLKNILSKAMCEVQNEIFFVTLPIRSVPDLLCFLSNGVPIYTSACKNIHASIFLHYNIKALGKFFLSLQINLFWDPNTGNIIISPSWPEWDPRIVLITEGGKLCIWNALLVLWSYLTQI